MHFSMYLNANRLEWSVCEAGTENLEPSFCTAETDAILELVECDSVAKEAPPLVGGDGGAKGKVTAW
jgi:hypothetical protein